VATRAEFQAALEVAGRRPLHDLFVRWLT
jgi:hypothetical protein